MERTKARILHVDDHQDTRLMMAALLQDCGYGVLTAGSVAEALELARESILTCTSWMCVSPMELAWNSARSFVNSIEISRFYITQPMAMKPITKARLRFAATLI